MEDDRKLRIFACYECEDEPCILITTLDDEDIHPYRCPFKGKSIWKEMKTEEVIT